MYLKKYRDKAMDQDQWFTFGGACLAVILFIIFILLQGCATGVGSEGETILRKYEVPIEIKAPETLATGTSNYQ